MGFFRRKDQPANRELKALEQARLSSLAGKIAERMLLVQLRWAARLNARAQKFGRKPTNVLLSALGIGFGFYCLWLVISAFIE